MADLVHDAGDDSGQGEGQRPSIEALLAAFREASRHRGRKASRKDSEELEPSSRSRPGPERDDPESRLEPGSEAEPGTEPGTAGSPVEMIEETMAAFRKAERQAEGPNARERQAEKQARTEKQAPTEGQPRTEAARRRGWTELPEETSSSEEELFPAGEPSSGDEKTEEEEEPVSSEDLALAFRQALFEREGPEPSGPEEGGPEGEGPPSSGASGSEERQTSVCPSREGAETPGEAPAPSPEEPEGSFLWVTDQAAGQRPDGPSVPVGELSGPRALEAEAFLLKGGGEGPYRRLRRIRGHPDMNVYLKPVFRRRAPGQQSPVAPHVDGTWTEGGREASGALREKAAAINQRISTLMETGGVEEGGVELRLLRFIATRAQEFVPRRTEENSAEFVYPMLSPLLDQESQSGRGELAQILSMTARRIRKER